MILKRKGREVGAKNAKVKAALPLLHHLNAAQAMFSPPPEAHMTTTSFGLSFPSRTASSRTIGMHAEPV
jgi:hypothetical protein